MLRYILISGLFLGSFSARGAANAALEKSLKDSALMYGAYGDESVICGGDLLSYQILSETAQEVTVLALITQEVNYCASVIQSECQGVFLKKGSSYFQKSFRCGESR